MIRRLCFALLLAVAAWPMARAQGADPLKSDACKAALAQLEARDAEPPSNARAERAAAARDLAATACLGPATGRGGRSGAPEPAQAVRPATSAAPLTLPQVPAIALPAAPVPIPRPTVITTCDPAGCWDSEGRRLHGTAQVLMGPFGPCLVQGGIASCP